MGLQQPGKPTRRVHPLLKQVFQLGDRDMEHCLVSSFVRLGSGGSCSKGDVVLVKPAASGRPWDAGQVWLHVEVHGVCWTFGVHVAVLELGSRYRQCLLGGTGATPVCTDKRHSVSRDVHSSTGWNPNPDSLSPAAKMKACLTMSEICLLQPPPMGLKASRRKKPKRRFLAPQKQELHHGPTCHCILAAGNNMSSNASNLPFGFHFSHLQYLGLLSI